MYNEKTMKNSLRSRLLQLFDYNPETGEIRRRETTGSRARAGDVVGTPAHQGHLVVRVDGRLILAHQIAWIITNGALPDGVIVHINGDKTDNRIANLAAMSKREAHAKTRATEIDSSNVHEIFEYANGALLWKKSLSGKNRVAGNEAGHRNLDGYIVVEVAGKGIAAHRIVWLMHSGGWPTREIDHINGVRDDNRIENLRDVARRTNSENRRRPIKSSKTGFLGVTMLGEGRYRARIRSGSNLISLGVFGTAEQAYAAYVEAKRRLHEGCTI